LVPKRVAGQLCFASKLIGDENSLLTSGLAQDSDLSANQQKQGRRAPRCVGIS
jgi:hypothetical protein